MPMRLTASLWTI